MEQYLYFAPDPAWHLLLVSAFIGIVGTVAIFGPIELGKHILRGGGHR
jgi:hypothetical protein